MFSDIVSKVGSGSWEITEKSSLVYQISFSEVKVQFLPEKIKMIAGEKEFIIKPTDFSKVVFKNREEKTASDEKKIMTSFVFNGKVLFELSESSMSTIKSTFEKLAQLFVSDDLMPYNQVSNLIDEFALDAEPSYNPDLYRLLLIYKDRIQSAEENGFLHKKSKIISLMEEDSGKITENLGQTVKKGLGSALSGGFGGLLNFGLGIAKAGAGRVVKGFVNDVTESKSIMILTNKNVILVRQEEINEYDFDDASEIFEARHDETLAGVVDIFDDCENKVLDNVAQTKWNVFKTNLRKIKKEEEQNGLSEQNENSDFSDDDEFAVAEKKISKLKKMLDNGLISQEDFDAKKSDILSSL